MEQTVTKELKSGTSLHATGMGGPMVMPTVTPREELASQWVTLHQMAPSLTHRFQPSPCSTHCVGSTMVYAAMGLRHKPALVFSRVKPMVLFALWVIWKSRQVSDPPSKDRFPPFQHQPPSSCCFSMLVTPKNRTRELYPQCSGLWQPCSSETTNLKGSFFHFQPVFLNWAKLDKLQLTGEISDPALAGPTTNDAGTDPYTATSWPSPVNGRSLEFDPKKIFSKPVL